MSALSRAYETIDDAALGGFKKILLSFPEWRHYEYGFLVVGWSQPYVRQIGHEGFMDTKDFYYYTEPHSDHSTDTIDQTIIPGYASLVRAFCHTHPTPGSFSTTDFKGFKRFRELKANHTLRYNVDYYLMESDWKVRRSTNAKTFWEGEILKGLSRATP